MKRFADQNPGESLKEFVERVVKPTPDEMRSFREDVENFAKFLRENLSYKKCSVAEVVKSGSLGKGTATKDSDIDLVVYINGAKSMETLTAMRTHLLEAIQDQVKAFRGWGGRPTLKKMTKFSVSYTLRKRYGSREVSHEVDILPAFDILEQVGNSPSKIYAKISGGERMQCLPRQRRSRRYRKGRLYSTALAPLQIAFMDDFFQKISDCSVREDVKDAIRLLKYWKQENHLDIRSYSLELLAVHVYKTEGCRLLSDVFKTVLTLLTQSRKLRVAFNENYDADEYTSIRGPPFILDPANPFMDTMIGVHCAEVSQAARAMLGM